MAPRYPAVTNTSLKGILMTSVSVEAWSHGDGWLTVDTQEWINDRGEFTPDLTDDLRGWMDENGHDWPHDSVIAAWVEARDRKSVV